MASLGSPVLPRVVGGSGASDPRPRGRPVRTGQQAGGLQPMRRISALAGPSTYRHAVTGFRGVSEGAVRDVYGRSARTCQTTPARSSRQRVPEARVNRCSDRRGTAAATAEAFASHSAKVVISPDGATSAGASGWHTRRHGLTTRRLMAQLLQVVGVKHEPGIREREVQASPLDGRGRIEGSAANQFRCRARPPPRLDSRRQQMSRAVSLRATQTS